MVHNGESMKALMGFEQTVEFVVCACGVEQDSVWMVLVGNGVRVMSYIVVVIGGFGEIDQFDRSVVGGVSRNRRAGCNDERGGCEQAGLWLVDAVACGVEYIDVEVTAAAAEFVHAASALAAYRHLQRRQRYCAELVGREPFVVDPSEGVECDEIERVIVLECRVYDRTTAPSLSTECRYSIADAISGRRYARGCGRRGWCEAGGAWRDWARDECGVDGDGVFIRDLHDIGGTPMKGIVGWVAYATWHLW